MSRKSSVAQLLVIVAIAVIGGRAAWGAWAFTMPGAGDDIDNNMSVNPEGTGEGATTFLKLHVYHGSDPDPMNTGTGMWDGELLTWQASASPPTGGWTNGEATMKIWKNTQNPDTDPPLATRNVDFVDPP